MKLTAALLVLLMLAAAGCGGASNDTTTTATGQRTRTAESAATVMRHAVDRALAENLALSRRVLWTNEVPSSARNSTRGAALVEMRRSAADRRRERVRVRVIVPNVRVEAVHVDPSYERATATVSIHDRSRITRPGAAARTATANERVQIDLRRVGDEDDPPQFVVWQVSGAT